MSQKKDKIKRRVERLEAKEADAAAVNGPTFNMDGKAVPIDRVRFTEPIHISVGVPSGIVQAIAPGVTGMKAKPAVVTLQTLEELASFAQAAQGGEKFIVNPQLGLQVLITVARWLGKLEEITEEQAAEIKAEGEAAKIAGSGPQGIVR